MVVDDDKSILKLLNRVLQENYNVSLAQSGRESLDHIRNNPHTAAVVMDYRMPDMTGTEAARQIKELNPDIPIVIHTGYMRDLDNCRLRDNDTAFDVISKGESFDRLLTSVRDAVECSELRKDPDKLISYAQENYKLYGKSAGMRTVYEMIRKVCRSNANVVIMGETGTGKELVSRAIHRNSIRRNQPLGILNCNHKSPDLVASDLFGHIRGAFTSAIADRIGLFESTDEGTIFLDDICDLDFTTQAKLLRVLESGEYQRIGESEIRYADVRVLCATRRNLNLMVAENLFREDLYYRLTGITIELPPLSQRIEDIPMLVEKFRTEFIAAENLPPRIFDESALDVMLEYGWHGNVRQLRHTIAALMVTADSDIIMAADVCRHLEIENGGCHEFNTLSRMQDDFLKKCIVKALHKSSNNVAAAARLLKYDRSNLYKLIKRLNIAL